jgi:uncharacterized protein (TIGR02217 family)
MAFHDVSFPLTLAFGASGGPGRQVDIIELASGREHRNTAQSRLRRRYNAMTGVKSVEDARTLAAFYEARGGMLHSFRFRDPIDHRAENEILGTGDGVQTDFALKKTYGQQVRPISKPVAETVEIRVNGSVVPHTLLGQVVSLSAPDTGAIVTASFTFDVPVRFAANQLILALETDGAVNVSDAPLIEVLDDA